MYQMSASKLFLSMTVFCTVSILFVFGHRLVEAKPPQDLIITNLQATAITQNSAEITWVTNRNADSLVRYGVAPDVSIDGPFDPIRVKLHSVSLAGLDPSTTYAYCALSEDGPGNLAESCGVFSTPSAPGSEPGAGGRLGPARAILSGFAFPKADMSIVLHNVSTGDTLEKDVRARENGSFSTTMERVPAGLYFITIEATDRDLDARARTMFTFNFDSVGATYNVDDIILPPTLSLKRDVISWGDNILALGKALPNTELSIEIAGETFSVQSDGQGYYEALINSAQFESGPVVVMTRMGEGRHNRDLYSMAKTITLSMTSVPQADLNRDGQVDIRDFSIFMAQPADMNSDGKINTIDVSIFLRALLM